MTTTVGCTASHVGKKMDETREDSLTKHVTSGIHDVVRAKHIQSLFFVLPLIVPRGNRSAYCWCCAGHAANAPPASDERTHAACFQLRAGASRIRNLLIEL